MIVIVQRVKRASCIVSNKVINEIKQGFMLLVGFCKTDTSENVLKMARKVSALRIFDDEEGKINLNINDVKGEILSISQFTLYADTKKSNRPSFTKSMPKTDADELYKMFNQVLNETYQIVTKEGSFGDHMYLDIECDGPVTITLEV